ncbi:M20 metallopeptidase family protein [Desertibacillus haloalkaliphilus]|uniref:M20 metallopeptidase family protein n=1 Tax=Desertibacillus haloalkaliphilus TaxID=1328930 RepID=UPI001C27D66A|nr:M20 family metallopeptidase [Desertibacillus haloalkaliphilus]MBU8907342.1 amidohydrolase [Desertibacillus haloalkaliphilus]
MSDSEGIARWWESVQFSDHPMVEKAFAMKQQLIQYRRHFHRYPELSFQEFETAEQIEKHLRMLPGMKVKSGKQDTGLATGVIGEVGCEKEGPTIAIRADIDALPILEENEHEYKSLHEGIMHACGHDAHTAIGLGVAELLAAEWKQRKIKGKVRFIFQPAEENEDENGLTGSPYMIKAGVLDDVDAAMALHMDPELPLGEVKLHEGYSMANVDTFEAVIRGTGGHAAYPHLGTDPVWMLSVVLPALYGIRSRKVSPLDAAVLSIGEIRAGSSYNVIPSEVSIKGTMRSYDDHVREQLVQQLDQALAVVKTIGGSYQLDVRYGEPALDNDPQVTARLEETIQALFPTFLIHRCPFGLGGEDFGHMAKQVPSSMFFIGAGIPEREESGLHMPKFDIDECVLPIGAAILAHTALTYFRGNS